MLGSIIGDIVGSIYEFRNIKTKDFPLFDKHGNYTDDTVMTIAVADWLLRDPEHTHKALEDSMVWFAFNNRCPMGGYGGMFARWLALPTGRVEETIGENGKVQRTLHCDRRPYGSCGNGSAMRVSSVGWMFDTLEETLKVAEISAAITHNHPEGIKGAKATSHCMFMARQGASQDQIRAAIEQHYGYDLSMSVEELQKRYSWKGIDNQGDGGLCQDSVPQAIICALKAVDFEDAIRNAISIGGDSDTIGCITGAIAEPLYGIPQRIYDVAWSYLPKDFQKIVMQIECNGGRKMAEALHPRYTPSNITSLYPNEIFVFGSNLFGRHGGGAARIAYENFGAVWGKGVGLQGQSYAIPTMQGGVETIRPYVDEFIRFAQQHPELRFLVTRIGCGIAGFSDWQIAPLFRQAARLDNVSLPRSFAEILSVE